MSEIQVLDKGFVRLVDSMGNDLSIVRAARVSYDADWRSGEDEKSDEKLIRYLMKNKHTSPFEAVEFIFEVKAPIFIFRQWHRHRTWSYNEISARYTELDEGFYVPKPEHIGQQAASSKQARDLTNNNHARMFAADVFTHSDHAVKMYKSYLEMGIPRELARIVLPLGAYSRMFAKVNLHNLMHFLRLRLHAHAQFEIRQYALALQKLAFEVCPVAIAAFNETIG